MNKTANSPIYWTHLTHTDWSMFIAATKSGLCYVGSLNQPFDELSNYVKRQFGESTLIQEDEQLSPYSKEIVEYLLGTRGEFTVPFDFRGTTFQLAVWHALCRIPYGQTKSYSEIAAEVQKPSAVRAVGTAIGANPLLITVPCHRVIGKNGALSGYRGGMEMKKRLLELERDGVGDLVK
jgi:methylated-DNA-[protein]-cysteine S-methyltransferase